MGESEDEDDEEGHVIYVSREELVESSYAELLPLRPWQLRE